MKDDTNMSSELGVLRSELDQSFRAGDWTGLIRALETISTVGEHQGQRELCLRAQSLRELMGNRAGGRETPGDRVSELFTELMFHLSHFEWTCQNSH